jgi:hypothetical protein
MQQDDRNAPDFLRDVLSRYREDVQADKENQDAALDDFRFVSGVQWDPEVEKRRVTEGRPCLTINRLPQFIRQVTGDIRLNKPAISVRPVDSGADTKVAETYTGLIRNIESVSDADTAYINAADHAVTGGLGHFRVMTRYLADDAWEQEIVIEPIWSPHAVVWDASARKLTREDAGHCFVLQRIRREAARGMFPNSSLSDIDRPVTPDWHDWLTPDTALIAEYWVKRPVTRTLVRTPEGQVFDMTDADPAAMSDMLLAGGSVRQVESHKICSYLISAGEILAGPFDWPGRYIPIVPVIGSEIVVGDRVIRHGLVRFAKDPQRSYNYHTSADVEFAALQPKAPFLATVEQIKGLEEDWARANQDNQSVLVYNPDPQAPGPPQRVQPPVPSAAMGSLAARAAEDMKAVTGIYDAALGARSNETSGRAILARQREGDVGSFHYVDNLSKAIAHCGRILVDLIPKIYDSERVVRVLGEDGSADSVPINVQLPDGSLKHDLSVGRYDVVVRSGPSFSSRRDEAAQAMMEFMRVYPPAAGAIGDLVADAMDWPGAKEIAARLKAMMPPGLAERAKAEARGEDPPEIPEPPPGPEQVEAQAKAAKAEAEAMKAQIEAERMRAGMDLPLPQMPEPAEPPDPFAAAEAQAKARKAEADAVKAEAEAMKAQIEVQMMAQAPPQPVQEAPAPERQAPTVALNLGDAASEAITQAQASQAEAIAKVAEGVAGAVQAMQATADRMAEAARVIAAPKRIRRGADGRAEGVEAVL